MNIVYQGFLGSSFSDYLQPGQVDSFSVSLTAGYTYYLDVTAETTPLTISVGSLIQIVGPFNYVLTGNTVWFKPSSSGIYGIGIDTTSGGSGYYAISTHYTYVAPPPPPPAPPPPAPPPPALVSTVLHGASAQYIIADNNGSVYIEDTVAGRDGARTLPGIGQMIFTDGSAVFDHTGTAEHLSRLYHGTLNRAPDGPGLTFWIDQVDHAHVPLSAIANTLATSPEFIRHYGALSNTGFVDQLYQNVLGRPADASGLQYWSSMLASGTSRGVVSLSVAESRENKIRSLGTAGDVNDAEATRLYQAALHRLPETAGLDFWSGTLASGTTATEVAASIMTSIEFTQLYGTLGIADFVSMLYQNVLHRVGEAAGMQAWTGAMQQGMSRETVMVGFADSLENRIQTAGATHANWTFLQ